MYIHTSTTTTTTTTTTTHSNSRDNDGDSNSNTRPPGRRLPRRVRGARQGDQGQTKPMTAAT